MSSIGRAVTALVAMVPEPAIPTRTTTHRSNPDATAQSVPWTSSSADAHREPGELERGLIGPRESNRTQGMLTRPGTPAALGAARNGALLVGTGRDPGRSLQSVEKPAALRALGGRRTTGIPMFTNENRPQRWTYSVPIDHLPRIFVGPLCYISIISPRDIVDSCSGEQDANGHLHLRYASDIVRELASTDGKGSLGGGDGGDGIDDVDHDGGKLLFDRGNHCISKGPMGNGGEKLHRASLRHQV
ncbi:MAG: hypothetical protein Q9211_005292 [Gyalolechia sp. 1 TL-2023]